MDAGKYDVGHSGYIGFIGACRSGNLEFVRCIIEYMGPTDSVAYLCNNNYEGFIYSCWSSNIDLVKYLINYANLINSPIDIHAQYDQGFMYACQNGNTHLVKFLIEYAESIQSPIDIHKRYNSGFTLSVKYGYIELAQYLSSISISTDTKYLFDTTETTGYIFKTGLDNTDFNVHDYHGVLFQVSNGKPDYKFLDENVHRLNPKKSAK